MGAQPDCINWTRLEGHRDPGDLLPNAGANQDASLCGLSAAAVRGRTGAARRFKEVEKATALIWRLLRIAESRFREIDEPHLPAEVYRGVKYAD